ncbi:hypothetical protein DY000_02005065 [Brassica cretica]|uniref:Pentacotripeptide-repeat region of PRORP domain-containing protein n=2 Tax=Brassica cretica TaxID=69181 RepID=A0ABQ7CEW8_BRACR|nr:hypothetical protein DY000_02005065 [Brassica cretica]
MVSEGAHPDIVTYKILLDGLCDKGELEMALDILDKMRKRKMEFDISVYNIIIHGMCNASKIDDAWDLFCSLPLRGAVTALGTSGRSTSFRPYLNYLNFRACRGVKPNVITHNIMIGGLCKKGSLSKADMLFRKMGEDGIAPDDCTYNILIRAHLRGGELTASAELIEEMKSCGFSADASTVKMVMDMLSSGELDKSFLNMLS